MSNYGTTAYGGLTGESSDSSGIGAGATLGLHQRHVMTGNMFIRDGRHAVITVSSSTGRLRVQALGLDVGRGQADWNDKR